MLYADELLTSLVHDIALFRNQDRKLALLQTGGDKALDVRTSENLREQNRLG